MSMSKSSKYQYGTLMCNPADSYVSDDDVGSKFLTLDIIASIASSFSLGFVALLIFSDPKLQKYPNDLIAVVFVCYAFIFFQYATRCFICGFDLSMTQDYIFAVTVQYPFRWLGCQFDDDPMMCWMNQKQDLNTYMMFDTTQNVMLGAWYFITIFISYISQFLMTATIYDMKLVLQNPFQNSQKRVPTYFLGACSTSLVFTTIGTVLTKSTFESEAQWNLKIFQIVSLVNCIFAVYTMIWMLFRFQKPGISSTLKREIRSRYLEFLVLQACFAYPICYITKPSYRYFDSIQFYMGGTYLVDKQNQNAFYVIILFSGIIIALSRFRDRLMQTKIKSIWHWLTCKTQTIMISEAEERAADLNTFLTTSLNTELVVTILMGIQVIAATSSDNPDNMSEQDMLKVKQTTSIEITNIKIKNVKRWEAHGSQLFKDQMDEENLIDEIMLTDESEVDQQEQQIDRLTEWFNLGNNERDRTTVTEKTENFSILPGATVTAHATSLFQRLRLIDGIDFQQISQSLHPSLNRDQIFQTGEASGASGSFFFFSHDKRFIVKTMTKSEMTFIQQLLPDLFRHFKKYPNSLLARVYGVYTVKMKNYDEVYLILMGNCLRFQKSKQLEITRIYDLKGSKVKRFVDVKNELSSQTLKDVNFMRNKSFVQEVNFKGLDAKKILKQLRIDSQMLAKHNIMDYSVLLGIENKLLSFNDFSMRSSTPRKQKGNKFDEVSYARHRFQSKSNNQIFHISVIDYLQEWNKSKRMEQFLKTTFLRADDKELSAVEPLFYQERFFQFMRNHVITKESDLNQSKQGIDLFGMAQKARNRITTRLDTIIRKAARRNTAQYTKQDIDEAKKVAKTNALLKSAQVYGDLPVAQRYSVNNKKTDDFITNSAVFNDTLGSINNFD